ncbi:MAG: 16S rRNA (adenine(1518)-N(6)/adenine(1519)-N(6))-dimethyltransferase RsmA [Candidatus Bathyarchaeota archaeon]|jgi:16S rRNA (adenine1518-N6/adenine1519-N6)-dimethyltransferase|nr:ribosomal RNA small subunit methyltransferase A [Candidatus Bathyarchaeota archaeon A05DMB-3]MDH7606301.1 16S rRNA (adenine(1518)-N(6)/adenine(1519)-N(6))-dimethyltransferase RsmA [Candidatus Bathyarchaeota archaeon]
MSILEKTKFLLRKHRIFPKKRLGQHFTVDSSIFQRMAECAALTRGDVVLDIGAGLGFLTRFLAERCEKVLAVEVDLRLVWVLRELLKDLPNVVVVEGDVFKVQFPPFNKVVSIPSYNISSALIQWLFGKDFDCAVLVFQKEFANRLLASVGSEDYGWLTVLAYHHFEVELFDEVPKWMFYPPPEVDSVIVRLKPRVPPPFHVKDEAFFRRLVQTLFTQRNRKVRNAVQSFIKKQWVFAGESAKKVAFVPFHERRVRELAPEDFGELANVLSS